MKYIGKNGDNSYLLLGEKSAVIECMRAENAEYHLQSIEEALNGREPDYIILNHTAPENVGSLPALMERYPKAVIVASAAGIKNLTELFNREFDYLLAKDQAELDLGNDEKLIFEILPNLPWTDTMVAYYVKEKALFCGSIFCDQPNYFKNTISVYREYAKTAAQRLQQLEIHKLLPMCGAELTEPERFFEKYAAESTEEKPTVILYASHYGYTEEMAQTVYEAIRETGRPVQIFNAETEDFAEIKDALRHCSSFAVGTNTVNRNAAESVWRLITDMDLVNQKNTPCMIFGSCGWSGEGVYLVERFLKSIRMQVFKKPFLVKFKMSDSERGDLATFAKEFIERE